MSLKSWDDDSGADFGAPTTTDLSASVGDPFKGSSMSGGNATTSKPDFGGQAGQGSFSEGTALVMDTASHDFGDDTDVQTALGDVPQADTTNNRIEG